MTVLAAERPDAVPPRRFLRLKPADLGILPLMVSLPFMYYPKLLEGDTQPWILLCALIALLTFRTRRFVLRSDLHLIVLALLCVVVYGLRSEIGPGLLRAAYTQLAFITLWVVCSREQGDYFPTAVRLTIVAWLAVGLYQYVSVALGAPIETPGRFVEGRSGVPSLTSEASTYGSLSMVHMMYLLSEGKPKNRPYVAAAAASVVLSGSLLAFVLLVFPLMQLRLSLRIAAMIAIPVFVFVDFALTSAGLASRILGFGTQDSGFAALLLDPSLNLRLGHIYFTLVENLANSLFLGSPVSFMTQYNNFAADSGVFIQTGSDFILPAAGELIYGSGLVGAMLLFAFMRKAQARSVTRGKKLEKIAFIAACMLNPISMSNVFLVMYAQQKELQTR